MSLDLRGMADLRHRLEELGRIGDHIEEKALKAGAEIIRKEISRRAPKNTGRLAEHIIYSEVVKGNIDVGPHKDYFYARFLEYGTKFMSAEPFIEPAYLAVKGEVQRVMANVIRRELQAL